jgi:hypothetical protein
MTQPQLNFDSVRHIPRHFSHWSSPFTEGFLCEAGFLAEDRERSLFIKNSVPLRPRPENKTGKKLGGTNYPALPGPQETERLIEEGATLLIKNAHYHKRALNLCVLELARQFGPAIGCNLYYTPRAQSGFAAHSDLHHSIIWQIEGSKSWTIDGQTFSLCAGDALILPKGVVHSARTSSQASLHATFSVHLLSFLDLLEQLQDTEVTDTADCQRAWLALQEQTPRLGELLQSARVKWVSNSGVLENTTSVEGVFSEDILYRWRADRFIQIVADEQVIQVLSTKKSWTLMQLPHEVFKSFINYSDFVPSKLPHPLRHLAEEWFQQRLLCPVQF